MILGVSSVARAVEGSAACDVDAMNAATTATAHRLSVIWDLSGMSMDQAR